MDKSSNVSVIVPIKGRSHLFGPLVQSLVRQTYLDWEAVVVDDSSSAAEYERIAAFAGSDQRIRLLRNSGPRSGACACRNAGFAASTGPYVVFVDSDDALAETCLAHRVDVMERNPGLDFAAFPMWVFHQAPGDSPFLWNTFTAEDDLDRFLRADSPWNTSGVIWRRASLARTGLWDERAQSWQDWEFHIRALADGMQYLKTPEPDSFWRAPTAAGSIGSVSTSSRHAFRRVRLLKAVTAGLAAHGVLTPRRRRALGMQFFNHAFRSRQSFRRMLLIWRTGRRAKAVSLFEFWAVLFCELLMRTARRLSRGCEGWLYPDLLKAPQYGRHRSPPTP